MNTKTAIVNNFICHHNSSSLIPLIIIIVHLVLSVFTVTIHSAHVSKNQENEDVCERVTKIINRNRQSRTSIPKKVDLWPNGIVPFKIAKSLGKYKKYIYQAMNEYHQHSCIRFEPRKRTDKSFIQFINDTSCYSTVVGKSGGEQIISLGPGCYYKGTIVHEIGHALGFEHEHQRSDRDEHIVIHIDKVDGDKETIAQFDKNQHDCNLTVYDPNSVMHYGEETFAKPGEVTISTDKSGITLTSPVEKYGLSELDIFAVNVLYNCN